MNLVLVMGIPGSGKSTYIDKHLKNYQLFCGDDLFNSIGIEFHTAWYDKDSKEKYILNKSAVHAVKQTACEASMIRKRPIVIDDLNLEKDVIKYWLDLADKYKYKKTAIILRENVLTCFYRREILIEDMQENNDKLLSLLKNKDLLNRFDSIDINRFDLIKNKEECNGE